MNTAGRDPKSAVPVQPSSTLDAQSLSMSSNMCPGPSEGEVWWGEVGQGRVAEDKPSELVPAKSKCDVNSKRQVPVNGPAHGRSESKNAPDPDHATSFATNAKVGRNG